MFLCILVVCVCSFLERFYSKTLGKEIMGIDVRSRTGGKCGVGKAFLRNLLRPIDAIGFYRSSRGKRYDIRVTSDSKLTMTAVSH